jgi:hypothetical protein
MRRIAWSWPWAGLVVAACGSPSGAPDGMPPGIDGETIDASIDAPSCAVALDTDDDGVCDERDVCPETPDPGQVDLDGDGRGWVCDDTESITWAGSAGSTPEVEVLEGRDFLTAVFQARCTDVACDQRVAIASPDYGYVSPDDAPWLDVPWALFPMRTLDDELIFRRMTGPFPDPPTDIGRFDPVAGEYAPYALDWSVAFPRPPSLRRDERTLLAQLRVGGEMGMYEPIAGQTPRLVGTALEFHPPQVAGPEVIEGTTPLYVFGAQTADGNRLVTFSPGAATLGELSTADGTAGPWAAITLVARTSDALYYDGRTAEGVHQLVIVTREQTIVRPLAGPARALTVIEAGVVLNVDTGVNISTLVLENETSETVLLVDEPTPAFHVHDSNPILVEYVVSVPDVRGSGWTLTEDGTLTLLRRDMRGVQFATKDGSVAAIFTGGADRRFIRRTAAGETHSGLLVASIGTTLASDLVLAHDDSLLVDYPQYGGLVAVPPGTNVPVSLSPNGGAYHFARTSNATICSAVFGNAYAYHDAALQPLSASGVVRDVRVTTDSSFVAFEDAEWRIARTAVAVDGTVELVDEHVAASSSQDAPSVHGMVPGGGMVVVFSGAPREVVLLHEAQPPRLLARSTWLDIWTDSARLPHSVLAVAGEDVMGRYVCSTEEPDQCWVYPEGTYLFTNVSQLPPLPAVTRLEDLTRMTWRNAGTDLEITVFRPRGHPDRPAPSF